jgi:hypothetical protein
MSESWAHLLDAPRRTGVSVSGISSPVSRTPSTRPHAGEAMVRGVRAVVGRDKGSGTRAGARVGARTAGAVPTRGTTPTRGPLVYIYEHHHHILSSIPPRNQSQSSKTGIRSQAHHGTWSGPSRSHPGNGSGGSLNAWSMERWRPSFLAAAEHPPHASTLTCVAVASFNIASNLALQALRCISDGSLSSEYRCHAIALKTASCSSGSRARVSMRL